MAARIYDLSKKELSDLLRINFFKIGIKPDPTVEELEIFIADIYKNHGGKTEEIFSDAFNELCAGVIEVKEKMAFSPFFVNRLMRAYRANKFGQQYKSPEPQKQTDEDKWKLFFNHIKFYKSMPESTDWIALFNHCVAKGWITQARRIEEFSTKAYRLAAIDVKDFVILNWGDKITNVNFYEDKR